MVPIDPGPSLRWTRFPSYTTSLLDSISSLPSRQDQHDLFTSNQGKRLVWKHHKQEVCQAVTDMVFEARGDQERRRKQRDGVQRKITQLGKDYSNDILTLKGDPYSALDYLDVLDSSPTSFFPALRAILHDHPGFDSWSEDEALDPDAEDAGEEGGRQRYEGGFYGESDYGGEEEEDGYEEAWDIGDQAGEGQGEDEEMQDVQHHHNDFNYPYPAPPPPALPPQPQPQPQAHVQPPPAPILQNPHLHNLHHPHDSDENEEEEANPYANPGPHPHPAPAPAPAPVLNPNPNPNPNLNPDPDADLDLSTCPVCHLALSTFPTPTDSETHLRRCLDSATGGGAGEGVDIECPVCGFEMPGGWDEERRARHVDDCCNGVGGGIGGGVGLGLGGGGGGGVGMGVAGGRVGRERGGRREFAVFVATEKTAPKDQKTGEALECIFCLDDLLPLQSLARLSCYCIFHEGCIKEFWEVDAEKGGGGKWCPTHRELDGVGEVSMS
ncbi:hypothetical protein JCM11641_002445 [Rhodosporidiobolus odoratus]